MVQCRKAQTSAIDPGKGIPGKPVAYAISDFNSLTKTIQEVAAGQGTLPASPFICHLTCGQKPLRGTRIKLSNGKIYRGKIGVLAKKQAKKIADWADNHSFENVVWAFFAVKTTPMERIQELRKDPILLENTKQYIRDVPAPLRSQAEKEILEM